MESSARGVDEVAVEIGVDERRDALRLMETLIPFHSFLVQHAGEEWIVHARVPGCHGESLEDLLVAIEDWGARNGVREFTCVLDDKSAERKPA
jgi:hypothetical protein